MAKRFLSLIIPLFLSAIALGIVSGALMNAINGYVSPAYFGLFFYIRPFAGADVVGPAMLQGMREGGAYGVIIGFVFSLLVFGVSKGQCAYPKALPYLFKMLALVWVCWIAGGLNGLLAMNVLPLFNHNLVFSGTANAAFFWVGGSIWGSYLGCITGLIFGCSWFARDWKRGKIARVA